MLFRYDGKGGYISYDMPTLAICYQNGKLQLMRDCTDDSPIYIDTAMTAVWCQWNSYGSVLAVAGITSMAPVEPGSSSVNARGSNVLQFYSPFGEKLKTLRIPGREVTCCSWEGGSLRVAISVDSHVYFANIRPTYKWTYFSKTVTFTNERMTKEGVCVYFWNTSTNTTCTKFVKKLVSMASCEEHCVLAAQNDSNIETERYVLIVCNAIATPVDTKYIELEPLWVTMSNSTVVAASKNQFLVWNFRTPRSTSLNASRNQRRSRVFHVDDTPTGVTQIIRDLDKEGNVFETPVNKKMTMDAISCIAVTDKILLVGRESGMIQRYSLPQITLTNRYNISAMRRPSQIAINCNSTRASIIDTAGILTLLDLNVEGTKNAEPQDVDKFERKDAWAMSWAQDNPSLLAILEKTRMYVFRGLDPEEPINCTGYICSFKDLEIRCVMLDQLVQKPNEATSELVVDLEVKSLRDTKELLSKVGLKEAHTFIQDNPHPRLWRLLAESALKELDLETAENAMVRCTDYLGIRFIKRLHNIHNDRLKKAEIAAFLGEYDEAEKMYLDLDRKDLAIQLRQKVGDYFQVLQLMKIGIGSISDKQTDQTYEKLGDFFAERQNWEGAREYYEKSRCYEKLIDCYYKLEDYHALAALTEQLPDKSASLKRLAKLMASVGMCHQAVTAYVKYGDVKQAVETCVRLNHWDRALELAKTYKMAAIGELMTKYANHLLQNNKRLQAVELYRKANCPLEAAKLLVQLAVEQTKSKSSPQRIKKIYVLAALLVEEHARTAPVIKGARSNILMGLSASDEDRETMENVWRGAEAFHFFLLAHRQIYAGDYEDAMKTAMRLREYEGVLETEEINCLLGLSSCISRSFSICSKAFIKLEALADKKELYEELAVEIFNKFPPVDNSVNKEECVNCETLVPDWCTSCPNCATKFPPCVVTGKSIMDLSGAWICSVCRHYAISERDVRNISACPLCHSAVTYM